MEMLTKTDKRIGKSITLGAALDSDGVNFSIFSKNTTAIDYCCSKPSMMADPLR